ncbi:hypothetical protein HGRIS_013213 [Hohenbuehelia grisea]|uniref:PhoD-like phosphatase domain-containing protein n=1 Tax=Hohenbuehelia grisea TaxID=104357 RepID=A0ABR3IUW2_9AGAR
MDDPGWHARRRADKDYYSRADGRVAPGEQLAPMDERFIGGFHSGVPPSPAPPAVPPKDYGFPRHGQQISEPSFPTAEISPRKLATMTAVERSQILRVARMEPHLQFMVGPLLRYDTVDEQGVWRGAALIVTADSGSIYEPHPLLKYEWDPSADTNNAHTLQTPITRRSAGPSFDLGPHPADPHSTILPTSPSSSGFEANGLAYDVPNVVSKEVPGHEFYVYAGHGGTFTFWRFLIEIPLGHSEMSIAYSINKGQQLQFYVPGRNQNMRWAAHSCNGFSAGVNPDDFRGPGFQSGYDPVWVDLLSKHVDEHFHVMIGGGDQLYCDSLTREPELQEWMSTLKPEEKKAYPLTEEISETIDRFFFNHYCQCFRRGAFARANSSIPMINMADDHDLIDGFGSYPDDLQMSPIFRRIGTRGYFFFLIFQCFINIEIDGRDDRPGQHINRSIIFGGDGPFIPYPSHSFLAYLGPTVSILLLDCRAERKKDQVCSQIQYQKVFERLMQLPPNVEHLVVQLGVPIAYPRMVFLEKALSSKLNPLVALGRNGSLGLSGFVNKFNAEAELLDDLNDHWTADSHKSERNWFIEQLQILAQRKRVRISFVSGDVHCAAVGLLKTLRAKNKPEILAESDHRYMLNVVTSAIVNTPPPNGVITMVSTLATKVHRTLHHVETDETMVPVFETEPHDGTKRKQKFVMGKRNWCSARLDDQSGELVFVINVEKEKGHGKTAPYEIRAPPPRWAQTE